jgi:hypothetical protein
MRIDHRAVVAGNEDVTGAFPFRHEVQRPPVHVCEIAADDEWVILLDFLNEVQRVECEDQRSP